MLKGDCNNCVHGNEPDDSEVCIECGISRKHYTPIKAEYISRDLALSFPFATGEYDHERADPHFINGCETYKEWLEQLPAADVAEVRHGHWIRWEWGDGDEYYDCSVCGISWTYLEGGPRENNTNYCPRCGAKMDEEDEDGQTT